MSFKYSPSRGRSPAEHKTNTGKNARATRGSRKQAAEPGAGLAEALQHPDLRLKVEDRGGHAGAVGRQTERERWAERSGEIEAVPEVGDDSLVSGFHIDRTELPLSVLLTEGVKLLSVARPGHKRPPVAHRANLLALGSQKGHSLFNRAGDPLAIGGPLRRILAST